MSATETETGPTISSDERLARFILFRGWIRHTDQTIKSDAFIPYPHSDLSVTRHINLTEQQIWEVGQTIASVRKTTLYGRADISAAVVRRQALEVKQDPVEGNPNHTAITGWPTDKSAQKSIALELAAASTFCSHKARNS